MDYQSTLKGSAQNNASTRTDKISYFCQNCGAWCGSFGLEPTPELYIKHAVEIFAEVKRVLRDDGTLWLNIGDSYTPFPVRTCLSPISAAKLLKEKDLVGIPWMIAFALRADGWYLRSDIIWHKPNPMPESVTDRPTKSHEYIFLLSKSKNYYYDADAIREPASYNTNARVSRAMMDHKSAPTGERNGIRSKYKTPDGWDTTKGEGGHGSIHKEGREKGHHKNLEFDGQKPNTIHLNRQGHQGGTNANGEFYERRNKRTVWTVPTMPYRGAHFATFPEALITPCILAGAPEGGIVLDPFAGSGTTLAVAKMHNRKYIGIELNPEYIKLAEKRIAKVSENLFT